MVILGWRGESVLSWRRWPKAGAVRDLHTTQSTLPHRNILRHGKIITYMLKSCSFRCMKFCRVHNLIKWICVEFTISSNETLMSSQFHQLIICWVHNLLNEMLNSVNSTISSNGIFETLSSGTFETLVISRFHQTKVWIPVDSAISLNGIFETPSNGNFETLLIPWFHQTGCFLKKDYLNHVVSTVSSNGVLKILMTHGFNKRNVWNAVDSTVYQMGCLKPYWFHSFIKRGFWKPGDTMFLSNEIIQTP